MGLVKVCDADGGVIPDGQPYILLQYVQASDGRTTRNLNASGLNYFHTGLCAAGWLGKLLAQNDVPQGTPEDSPPLPGVSRLANL